MSSSCQNTGPTGMFDSLPMLLRDRGGVGLRTCSSRLAGNLSRHSAARTPVARNGTWRASAAVAPSIGTMNLAGPSFPLPFSRGEDQGEGLICIFSIKRSGSLQPLPPHLFPLPLRGRGNDRLPPGVLMDLSGLSKLRNGLANEGSAAFRFCACIRTINPRADSGSAGILAGVLPAGVLPARMPALPGSWRAAT